MLALLSTLSGLRRNEGQGMAEYTLVIGVISLVIVGAFLMTGIQGAVADLASTIADDITP